MLWALGLYLDLNQLAKQGCLVYLLAKLTSFMCSRLPLGCNRISVGVYECLPLRKTHILLLLLKEKIEL